jgi:transposase-like protein
LFQAHWPEGFRCPHCGYHKHCQRHTRKVFQCIRCKHQASLAAGTLFEHTQLALSRWHLAIYLLTQAKNGISAMDLKRQLGVSYNTAWMITHKLMQAMREHAAGQRQSRDGRNLSRLRRALRAVLPG